jgi:hypothetical protein
MGVLVMLGVIADRISLKRRRHRATLRFACFALPNTQRRSIFSQ